MPRARLCLGRVPARGWSPRLSSSSPRTVEAEPVPFPRAPAAGELPGRGEQPGSAPSLAQPLPPPPLPSCPPLLPPPASPSPGFSHWERGWGGSRTPRALAMPGAGKVGFLPRLSSGRWRRICPGPGLLGHPGSAEKRLRGAHPEPCSPCPVEPGPARDPAARSRHPEGPVHIPSPAGPRVSVRPGWTRSGPPNSLFRGWRAVGISSRRCLGWNIIAGRKFPASPLPAIPP